MAKVELLAWPGAKLQLMLLTVYHRYWPVEGMTMMIRSVEMFVQKEESLC